MQEDEDANILVWRVMQAVKTKAGKAAVAARIAAFCEAHSDYMEFEWPILRMLPLDCLVDLLHALDINIPQRACKFSFHDQVLFAEFPDLPHALTAYYSYIGCDFDLLGEKSWWHGAVWHYDFVMGSSKESPGLDMNILMICLVAFGVEPEATQAPARVEDTIVDDLDDGAGASSGAAASGGARAAAATSGDLEEMLRPLFGKNTDKVP